MSKIIIHNESKVKDQTATNLVLKVLSNGFQSGSRQYCWATHFDYLKVAVLAMKTRGNTFTFKVVYIELKNDY